MKIDILESQNNLEDNTSIVTSKDTNKKITYESFNFKQEELPQVSIFQVLLKISNRFEIILLLIGIIGSIGNGITLQLIEYFTGEFVDYLNEENITNDKLRKKIKKLCIKNLIFSFVSLITSYLMMCFFIYFARLISNKYKIEYFKNVLSMDQIWFDLSNKSSFDMTNKMVLELETIENGIGITFGNIISEISCFIFGIIFSLIINWKFSLILLSIFPIIILIQFYISNLVNRENERQRKVNEKEGGYMEEILYKIKTVASFVNFDFEENNYNKLLEQSLKVSESKSKKVAISTGIVIFSIHSLFSITFIVGSILLYKKVKTNGKLITVGDIYAILALISGSSSILPELTQNIQLVSNCTSGAKFFFYLNDFKNKLTIEKKKLQKITKKDIIKIDKNEIKGSIKFINVTFSYPNKEPVLKNFNLEIPMGKTTALVGESGCGKSTIVKLIERIYNPNEGYILLDEKYDIKDLDIKNYRDSIGYVAQEPILFNDTIKNNLLFGRKIENEEENLKIATEKSHIYKFINNLNEKFNHIVGVKGGKLSGGQKQRIAIARALLNNPKILIFDEATSALDNKSEKQVQKSINSLQGKVTIIIIAHRLTTIEKADNIIFLGKQGEILENGNHEELMNKKGKYYELYNQGNLNNDGLKKKKSSFNESSYSIENKLSEISLRRKNSVDDIINKNELSTKESIKKLFTSNKGNNYMKYFYLGCICALLSGGFSILNGLIFGYGTNALSNKDLNKARKEGIKYGIIIFLTSILSFIIEYIRFWSFSLFGEKLINDFKRKIFHKFLGVHLSFYDINSNTPGELVSKVNLKTSAINGVVLSLFSMILECIGNFTISTILGFVYEYKLTLINLAFIPLIVFINYYSAVLTEEDENNKLNNKYGDVISENLSGVLTIFSFNSQENSIKQCEKEVYKGSENYFKFATLNGLFFGLTMFIAFIVYCVIYYSSAEFIIKGSSSFSKVIKCYGIISTGTFFIGICVKNLKNISLMKKAINELIEQTEIKSEINPFNNSNDLISKLEDDYKGKIEFKNVTFSYPTNKKQKILKNISFIIKPGEKIGFMGKSGSGKSTITQLIERFYDCDQGEILIDDINIKKYNLINLRKIISTVQQEPVLFSQLNIRENIKYGKLEIENEKIDFYGKKTNIYYKINEKSSDTLSGGEKQRVAIARALIKNAKILIMDEATSALDNKSENEIQNMLDNIIQEENITVIVIAHRLKAIQKCDKIYKIQNGEIIDSGSLKEIMEKENK